MEAVSINENSWYFSGAVGRAFLFKGEKAALLVDSTNGPGDLRGEIRKLIGDFPVILVNTHADSDHIGCNDQFETALMHPGEFAYYAAKRKEGYAVPAPLFEGTQRNLRALIASLKKLQEQYLDAFDFIFTAHQDLRLDKSFIAKELAGAEALLAGRLTPEDAGGIPLEPPEFRPASRYTLGESGFFYYTEPDH